VHHGQQHGSKTGKKKTHGKRDGISPATWT
jgi:hypothetical protein